MNVLVISLLCILLFHFSDITLRDALRQKEVLLKGFERLMHHTEMDLIRNHEIQGFCLKLAMHMPCSLRTRKQTLLCLHSKALLEACSFNHFLVLLAIALISYLDYDILDSIITKLCKDQHLQNLLGTYSNEVNAYKARTKLYAFVEIEGELPRVNPPLVVCQVVQRHSLCENTTLKELEFVRNSTESVEDLPLENFALLVAKIVISPELAGSLNQRHSLVIPRSGNN